MGMRRLDEFSPRHSPASDATPESMESAMNPVTMNASPRRIVTNATDATVTIVVNGIHLTGLAALAQGHRVAGKAIEMICEGMEREPMFRSFVIPTVTMCKGTVSIEIKVSPASDAKLALAKKTLLDAAVACDFSRREFTEVTEETR